MNIGPLLAYSFEGANSHLKHAAARDMSTQVCM